MLIRNGANLRNNCISSPVRKIPNYVSKKSTNSCQLNCFSLSPANMLYTSPSHCTRCFYEPRYVFYNIYIYIFLLFSSDVRPTWNRPGQSLSTVKQLREPRRFGAQLPQVALLSIAFNNEDYKKFKRFFSFYVGFDIIDH